MLAIGGHCSTHPMVVQLDGEACELSLDRSSRPMCVSNRPGETTRQGGAGCHMRLHNKWLNDTLDRPRHDTGFVCAVRIPQPQKRCRPWLVTLYRTKPSALANEP